MNKLTTKKCPFCAEKIKTEAIVCRFCNRDLGNLNLTKRVVIERTAKKFKKHMIIAFVLTIVGGILFLSGVFEFSNKESDVGAVKVFFGFWFFVIGLVWALLNKISIWWDRG